MEDIMKKIIALFLVCCTLAASLCLLPAGAASEDPSDSYTYMKAPYEDASLDLWFDFASKKITPDNVSPTDMESFSVYMAKNEIEDAQFVLLADKDRSGLTAEIDGFKNEAGDTLSAELFIELYHDCGYGNYVPDAIPPLSAYGAFDLSAGKTQAFLVKITSEIESAAGWYETTLTIKDSAGKAIKCAKIFVYVWDFALSEETACATSINLSKDYLSRVCMKDFDGTINELYKNYYDYLLENRISAYFLPYELYDDGLVEEYMDNPRVTSYQLGSYTSGSAASYNDLHYVYSWGAFTDETKPHRFDKAYYFAGVVDAATPADLERLKDAYDGLAPKLEPLKPSYAEDPVWFISTYINDIDYTLPDGSVIDQVDYYDDFVNLLCSKTFAYTSPEELTTPGAKVMQDLKWNEVYGTFEDRMAQYREDGKKVWWFISWDVEAPYINYYMQTDGTAQRLLFWQQYDFGVEGFLYNFANFWIGDCEDPYNNNITNGQFPNAHGESILIYPGNKYGLDTPVGSLRLEAMRDGIEDYQMFTMLDKKMQGAAEGYIHEMTTGVVTYSTSAEDYYKTRIALGNAVEASENGVCAHDYAIDATLSTPAGCENDGENVYVCAYCADSYTEAVPATGHTFVDGTCSACGAADKPAYTLGDINADGAINGKDSNQLKQIISGASMPTEAEQKAADVNGDGSINGVDANMFAQFLAGALGGF